MTFKPAHLLVVLLATAIPAMAQNIATVNGKAIPSSKVELILKQAKAQGQQDTPQLRAQIKDRLITCFSFSNNGKILFNELLLYCLTLAVRL